MADTNIYISAYSFGGLPSKVLELAQENHIKLFISPSILEEIRGVLAGKFKQPAWYVEGVASNIRAYTVMVHPAKTVKATPNAGDNNVIACGLAASADYIVSGDKKHLLALKNFQGMAIVSPATFVKEFPDSTKQPT